MALIYRAVLRAQAAFFTRNLRSDGIKMGSPTEFQLSRIAARMEHGQNQDAFLFDEKVNDKRKAAENDGAPHFASDFGEQIGIVRDTLKALLDGGSKFQTQAFAFSFIPSDGIVILQFRDTTEDDSSFHFWYFASSLALTSSQETTSLGLSKWSCRRRSISSASPGASSREAAMPSHRLRHNSTCSANGSARASLNIVSALMASIYRAHLRAQAEFFTRVAFHQIQQSEMRSKRVATDSGKRDRPGRSQRRPRRWPHRLVRVQTRPVAIPQRVRRGGAPKGSRGGCAPHESLRHNLWATPLSIRNPQSAIGNPQFP
jgi:hypothetical protein